jgi:hypothetical protein
MAEPGEVLGAGGRVLLLIDPSDQYMNLYLPASVTGRLAVGDDARILLDALPDRPLPAKISFRRRQIAVHPQRSRNPRRAAKAGVPRQTAPDPPSAVPQAKPGMPGAGYVRTHRRLAGQPAMSGLALQANGISPPLRQTAGPDRHRFSLPAGTRCGLIGPDGAGKSSLLGLIAGVKTLQQGQLEVLGGSIQDRRHRNSLYPRIAFMPQGLGGNLYPELSISENIRFSPRCSACPKPNASSACTACCWPPTCCACRAPGRQTVWRHEAEARPVLRADPRAGPADPRRTDHRRRPAVAAALLGTGRRCARSARN